MNKSTRNRTRFLCLDCKVDTGKAREFYYLVPKTWRAAHDSISGMLCVGCIETRLGRTLTPSDFTNATINNPKYTPMSDRLRSRIVPVHS